MAGNSCTRYAREIAKRHGAARVIVIVAKAQRGGLRISAGGTTSRSDTVSMASAASAIADDHERNFAIAKPNRRYPRKPAGRAARKGGR